ncbi:MAG: ATP synthase F1 subunit delta [Muribaculaceae bacterium]|nr:ATP synthase F1 subunit delta [Muribaculaceae bacterium]
MNQGLIPYRYAKALYKVALERNCTKELYQLMGKLAANFASTPSLQEAMCNPFIKTEQKKQLILTAAGIDNNVADDSVATATLNDFITLIDRNKRIAFFRDAVLAYIAIYRKECNISTVKVTSAAPLTPEASERLRKLIAAHKKGATHETSETVDPEILGGFIVNIDNERLDASIQNELKQLRLKLLSH